MTGRILASLAWNFAMPLQLEQDQPLGAVLVEPSITLLDQES